MSKVISKDSMKNRFVNTVMQLQKQSREQRTNQQSPRGYFALPVRASDPPVTRSGEFGLYYNSGSSKVRKSYNGGAWADTTI